MSRNGKRNLVLIFAILMSILAACNVSAARISKKKMTITVGKKKTLKVTGAKKVKWSSSNKKVASVSGKGVVKGVKAGSAKIVAKAGKKKYTCKVTVIAARTNKKARKTARAAASSKTENFASGNKGKDSTTGCKDSGSQKNNSTVGGKGSESQKNSSTAGEKGSGSQKNSSTAGGKGSGSQKNSSTAGGKNSGDQTDSIAAGGKSSENQPGGTIIGGCGSGRTTSADSTSNPSSNNNQYVLTPEEQRVHQILMEMKKRYPEGAVWGSKAFYAWEGGIYAGGRGCAAFAFMLSDEAFGVKPAYIHKDINRIKIGDAVRINNDSHFVVIIEKTTSGVVVVEGAYNGTVHWGRTFSLTELRNCMTYIVSRY